MDAYILDHVSNEKAQCYEILRQFLGERNIKDIKIIKNVDVNNYTIRFNTVLKPMDEKEAASLRYYNEKLEEEIHRQKIINNKLYSKLSIKDNHLEEQERLIQKLKDDKDYLHTIIKRLNRLVKDK